MSCSNMYDNRFGSVPESRGTTRHSNGRSITVGCGFSRHCIERPDDCHVLAHSPRPIGHS